MSIELVSETNEQMFQEYVGEWKIDKLVNFEKKNIRTPCFHPVPSCDLKFCFEVWYEINSNIRIFRVSLLKLFHSEPFPSLKMKIKVTVVLSGTGSNGIFGKFQSPGAIIVDELNSVLCINNVSVIKNANTGIYLRDYPVFLKCELVFIHDQLRSFTEVNNNTNSLKMFQSFTQCFSSVYESGALSDITIRIGSDEIPAHKFVLVAHSSVFMKMITDDFFVEAKTNAITIKDCDAHVFKTFLKYLYCGVLDDASWLTVKMLYVLADKYDINALRQHCANEITKSYLHLDYICDVLKLAYDYDDETVKQQAKKYAACHFRDPEFKEKWEAFVPLHPLIAYEVATLPNADPTKL